MKHFEYATLINDVFWFYVKDHDDTFVLRDFRLAKDGSAPLNVSTKDMSEFFDLSNKDDHVTKYMAENHSEIYGILEGTNDKFKFWGVYIHASGDVYFYFDEDGFFGEKVLLNMEKSPCFTIYIDAETRKYIRIESSYSETYKERKILSTKIEEYAYGKNVRTIKTSMSPSGEPIAIVTETK
ncbi:hypothetical protein IKW73_01595 [Candidatus Saccharibacteria bacterium]|nr:hypothetical protein [Candidatus Saccharibacteria bacterium]